MGNWRISQNGKELLTIQDADLDIDKTIAFFRDEKGIMAAIALTDGIIVQRVDSTEGSEKPLRISQRAVDLASRPRR